MDGKALTIETLAPRQLVCLRQFSTGPATTHASFTVRSSTARLSTRHDKWVPSEVLVSVQGGPDKAYIAVMVAYIIFM